MSSAEWKLIHSEVLSLLLSISVFSFFITVFGSAWQIELAICQILGTCKYGVSYRIICYALAKVVKASQASIQPVSAV